VKLDEFLADNKSREAIIVSNFRKYRNTQTSTVEKGQVAYAIYAAYYHTELPVQIAHKWAVIGAELGSKESMWNLQLYLLQANTKFIIPGMKKDHARAADLLGKQFFLFEPGHQRMRIIDSLKWIAALPQINKPASQPPSNQESKQEVLVLEDPENQNKGRELAKYHLGVIYYELIKKNENFKDKELDQAIQYFEDLEGTNKQEFAAKEMELRQLRLQCLAKNKMVVATAKEGVNAETKSEAKTDEDPAVTQARIAKIKTDQEILLKHNCTEVAYDFEQFKVLLQNHPRTGAVSHWIAKNIQLDPQSPYEDEFLYLVTEMALNNIDAVRHVIQQIEGLFDLTQQKSADIQYRLGYFHYVLFENSFDLPHDQGLRYLKALFANPVFHAYRDFNRIYNKFHNTPFLLAIRNSTNGPHPILEWFLGEEFKQTVMPNNKDYLNCRDSQGNTAVGIAAQTNWQCLQRLLEDKEQRFQQQINIKDDHDHTPLYHALQTNRFTEALLLLDHGADCSSSEFEVFLLDKNSTQAKIVRNFRKYRDPQTTKEEKGKAAGWIGYACDHYGKISDLSDKWKEEAANLEDTVGMWNLYAAMLRWEKQDFVRMADLLGKVFSSCKDEHEQHGMTAKDRKKLVIECLKKMAAPPPVKPAPEQKTNPTSNETSAPEKRNEGRERARYHLVKIYHKLIDTCADEELDEAITYFQELKSQYKQELASIEIEFRQTRLQRIAKQERDKREKAVEASAANSKMKLLLAKKPQEMKEDPCVTQTRKVKIEQDQKALLGKSKYATVAFDFEQFNILLHNPVNDIDYQNAVCDWISGNINIEPKSPQESALFVLIAENAKNNLNQIRFAIEQLEKIFTWQDKDEAKQMAAKERLLELYKLLKDNSAYHEKYFNLLESCLQHESLKEKVFALLSEDKSPRAQTLLFLHTHHPEDLQSAAKNNHLIALYAYGRLHLQNNKTGPNGAHALVLLSVFLLASVGIEQREALDVFTTYAVGNEALAKKQKEVVYMIGKAGHLVSTESKMDDQDASLMKLFAQDIGRKPDTVKAAQWVYVLYSICRKVDMNIQEPQALAFMFAALENWKEIAEAYKEDLVRLMGPATNLFSKANIDQHKSAIQAMLCGIDDACSSVKFRLLSSKEISKQVQQQAKQPAISKLIDLLKLRAPVSPSSAADFTSAASMVLSNSAANSLSSSSTKSTLPSAPLLSSMYPSVLPTDRSYASSLSSSAISLASLSLPLRSDATVPPTKQTVIVPVSSEVSVEMEVPATVPENHTVIVANYAGYGPLYRSPNQSPMQDQDNVQHYSSPRPSISDADTPVG